MHYRLLFSRRPLLHFVHALFHVFVYFSQIGLELSGLECIRFVKLAAFGIRRQFAPFPGICMFQLLLPMHCVGAGIRQLQQNSTHETL